MYSALERNRAYLIGWGDEAKELVFLNRDFPPDDPPVFNFRDVATGELIEFRLEQLTALEQEGALQYLGVAGFTSPTEEKDDG